MHKTLALLITDTPNPAVLALAGAYDKIFDTWLRDSLPDASSNSYTLDLFDVVNKQEYPPAETLARYDGIVITGSAASAYDDSKEWIPKLVEYIASTIKTQPKVKIIGICFGHQILARAVGGECVPNGKWEVGLTELELTDLGKQVFGVDSLNIQQMHRDHVPSVPAPMQLLGSTSVSMNQGMVSFYPPAEGSAPSTSLDNIHVFTVQGHPEFTEPIVSATVNVRAASGVFDPATAEDARRRANWRNDGVSILGKTVWKVLGVE